MIYKGLKLDVSYPKIDQENACGTHWQHLKIILRYLKGILFTKLVFERGHMLVTVMPIVHQKLQIGNMLVDTYSKYSVMAQQEATNYSYIIIWNGVCGFKHDYTENRSNARPKWNKWKVNLSSLETTIQKESYL